MGMRTKIDWCDASWNPVTGCLHGCEYCYARKIAERFSAESMERTFEGRCVNWFSDGPKELDYAVYAKGHKQPYPFGFAPTLHRYKLDEPQHWKKPRTIFVCSMADLFGAWVPMDWKIETLLACREAPQHRYLFLTKNPVGFCLWPTEKHPPEEFNALPRGIESLFTENMWFGVTYTGRERIPGQTFEPEDWKSRAGMGTNFWYLWRMSGAIFPFTRNKYLSIEPISCDICEVEDERNQGEKLLEKFICGEDRPIHTDGVFKWVIVGAETGNRKDRVIPERAWIDKLAALCDRAGVPIFMKESLREIMGDDFRQEFPWEVTPWLT